MVVRSSILEVLSLRCQLDSQAEMSIGGYPGCGIWERSLGWNIYLVVIGICMMLKATRLNMVTTWDNIGTE